MAKRTARLRVPADVGLAIQQARLERGMTQAELAHNLGLTQSTVSTIEEPMQTFEETMKYGDLLFCGSVCFKRETFLPAR